MSRKSMRRSATSRDDRRAAIKARRASGQAFTINPAGEPDVKEVSPARGVPESTRRTP